MNTRSAVVFPKDIEVLRRLGENIALAMKRRKITQTKLTERTGLSMPTLRNIIRGEASVSIGHYVMVLSSLGLSEDIVKVALDDEFGRNYRISNCLNPAETGKVTARIIHNEQIYMGLR